MAYGVRIECWGDYACFTRPEMKVERVSYDVMTPSAARGLVEAIFWHPGLRYVIDEIDVMNPIQMTNVRRNEVKSKINVSSIAGNARHGKALYLCPKEDIVQRAALILKNVRYCIHVHFEMTEKANASDNAGKCGRRSSICSKMIIRLREEIWRCANSLFSSTTVSWEMLLRTSCLNEYM